jgi:(2R)-ethylmalonyl-CoA mutase
VLDRLREEGVDPEQVPVIVGGVIPDDDERKLLELGVRKVYTPKDFDLSLMLGEIADLIGA